ncbi:DUF317 domain-containing protein [Streptomyces sp. NPDC055078]
MLRREQVDRFAAENTGFLDDVSPRYLAGPGDARHVTHALAAAGWRVRSDPLAPVVDLISPDHRYRLRHEPQTMAGGAIWSLHSDAPEAYWYAQFTAIPVEILAGLTDQLFLPPPAVGPYGVWDLLADADWSQTSHGDGTVARSPSGMVSVKHRQITTGYESRAWRIEARPAPDEGPRIWGAWIVYEPPPHLITGLAAALTDPSPLQRTWAQPEAHYSARRTESRVTPQAYVKAHRTRVDAVRARVRAARRANPPTSTAPAPPSTSTSTPAPVPSLRQAR